MYIGATFLHEAILVLPGKKVGKSNQKVLKKCHSTGKGVVRDTLINVTGNSHIK